MLYQHVCVSSCELSHYTHITVHMKKHAQLYDHIIVELYLEFIMYDMISYGGGTSLTLSCESHVLKSLLMLALSDTGPLSSCVVLSTSLAPIVDCRLGSGRITARF